MTLASPATELFHRYTLVMLGTMKSDDARPSGEHVTLLEGSARLQSRSWQLQSKWGGVRGDC
jgi:hypothetical protein